MEAKQTIERIERGHFRLMVVQHGDQGQNREIQVHDVVNNFMVKGVTEQAVIAHILLDSRTATNLFESIKGIKDLERELKKRDLSTSDAGFQRVVKDNKTFTKPKSAQRPWPKLRRPISVEERLAKERVPNIAESIDTLEPDELADAFQFDSDDAKGLFVGVTIAHGTGLMERCLEKHPVEGVLTEEDVQEIAVKVDEMQKIAEALASATIVEDEGPAVFDPTKKKSKQPSTSDSQKGRETTEDITR